MNLRTGEQQKLLDTLLEEAVRAKDLEHARLFVSRGASVHVAVGNVREKYCKPDRAGRHQGVCWYETIAAGSLLHLATLAGERALMDFLLDQGVELEVKTSSGNTPLMLAVMKHDTSLAKYLVDKGADPFAENKERASPLSCVQGLDPEYDRKLRQEFIELLVQALPEAKPASARPAEKADIAISQEMEATKPLVFRQKQRKGERFDL
jgi:ankyrin repeat protein